MINFKIIIITQASDLIVCQRSMGLSDIVWVDGRYGTQAKTKTKHAMQLKLAGHYYGI